MKPQDINNLYNQDPNQVQFAKRSIEEFPEFTKDGEGNFISPFKPKQ